MDTKKGLRRIRIAGRYFKNVGNLLFRPGSFFEGLSMERGYGASLGFLFFSSILFGTLSSVFLVQKRMLFGTIFFVNAFVMPLVLALILFLVTWIGHRNRFTFQIVFGITAYSNITLIIAWIPGLSWVAGLWKFYLIGLGMVKLGKIGGRKAFLYVAVTAGVLLSLIYSLSTVMTR